MKKLLDAIIAILCVLVFWWAADEILDTILSVILKVCAVIGLIVWLIYMFGV